MTELPQKAVAVALAAPRAVFEGSVLVARVQAEVPASASVRGEVELLRTISVRYREGREGGGTHLALSRTSIVAARQELPASEAEASPAGALASYDAEVLLSVPADGPASVDTTLVSVDWALRTRLVVDGGTPIQAVEKIRVLTHAPGLDPVTTAPPRAERAGHALVSIDDLAMRRVTPGTVLTGSVRVQPLTPGLVRSIRVELVLREQVLRGHAPGAIDTRLPGRGPADPRKDEESVVAGTEVAAGVEVTAALEPLTLPFELAVPRAVPAASVSTPYFELSWLLRAAVSRALQRDAFAEVNLVVADQPG